MGPHAEVSMWIAKKVVEDMTFDDITLRSWGSVTISNVGQHADLCMCKLPNNSVWKNLFLTQFER
jgi:hypothetical protein